MAVDLSKVDRPARATAWAEDIEPRCPASRAALIVGDQSMSRLRASWSVGGIALEARPHIDRLKVPDRHRRPGCSLYVALLGARLRGNTGEGEAETHGVVRARSKRRLQGEASVEIAVDLVAIARAGRGAQEEIKLAPVAAAGTPQNLVDHAIVVAAMRQRRPPATPRRPPRVLMRSSGNTPAFTQAPNFTVPGSPDPDARR
jgi:hypothetical protein